MTIPDGITRDDLLEAIHRLDAGEEHDFAPPTKYVLIHEGRHYPPKAVVGLAARRVLGHNLHHTEFSSGVAPGQAVWLVRERGFEIRGKTAWTVEDLEPTSDRDALASRSARLRWRGREGEPEGCLKPKATQVTTTTYVRDPDVQARVLDLAAGICERCGLPAPFRKKDGEPYLEVHHVRHLSQGGSDTIHNAVALCPNCHREAHSGQDPDGFQKVLRGKVSRLEQED